MMARLRQAGTAALAALALAGFTAAALAADRDTPARPGDTVALTAGEAIGAGWLCGVHTNGRAYAATTARGLRVIGRSEQSAAAGGPVVLRRGVFRWDASPTGTVSLADIGKTAWVAKTNSAYTVSLAAPSGVATNNAAGTIVDVDDAGVWVRSGF